MALLPDHFEQFLLLVAQATTATSQAEAVEFQLTAAHEHTENIHPWTQLPHGEGQLKPQQIGGCRLRFHLPVEHGLQQVDRQESMGQTAPQQLDVDGMGEVPEPTCQGQIHRVHPLKQRHRHGREQVVLLIG